MCCHPDNCSLADQPVEAVLFDLDDTIYPQAAWLAGAWYAVAEEGKGFGIPQRAFHGALCDAAAQGTDKGRIIDAALERIGVRDAPVAPLVAAFRRFEAPRLYAYPGGYDALRFLARRVRVGLVTDGDPVVQRSKIASLRLQSVFNVVVFSDELGRERRKPHPAPLIRAAEHLRVAPTRCVYVGDRPQKDVAAARAARMRSIRVRTGEYRWAPDLPRAWRTAPDLPRAVERLVPLLQGVAVST
jgi:putative hydrolase of the HAD superfamily